MRFSVLFTCVLCCLGWGTPTVAQSYEKLWKQVEANLEKDLPQSAVHSALAIYEKAQKEHNAPQMMKSYLVMTDARCRISEDSLQVDIDGLKRWAAAEKDSVNAAVLYSLLGEMCVKYDRDADWRGYLLRSVQPINALANCYAKDFLPMVELGDGSQRYEQNRMYPVLARRAIELLNDEIYRSGKRNAEITDGIYRNLQQYYLSHGQRAAYVSVTVDSLERRVRIENSEKRCRELIAGYGDVETVVKVYHRLCLCLVASDKRVEAVKLADEAIARYPKYRCINELKNVKKNLLKSGLSLSLNDPYPGKPETMKVNYKNLTAFDLKIYRLTVNDKNKVWNYNPKDSCWKGKVNLYRTEHYILQPTTDLQSRDTLLTVTIPEEGYYLFEAVPVKPYSGKCETYKSFVTVHALGVFRGNRYNDMTVMMVVDRWTGKAVPGAQVQFYNYHSGKYNPTKGLFTANKYGIIRVGSSRVEEYNRRSWLQAYTPDHQCMPIMDNRQNERRPAEPKESLQLSLYSDRSVYRLGQTVYVSGLAFTQKGDSLGVKSQLPVTLTLKDVNRKKVGETSVTTNEYGSFHATFALPTVCLNGRFSVEVTGKDATGRIGFQVEEYKRPQFDVKLLPVTELYKAGDTILVKGVAKRYTGVPVQDAMVKYTVFTDYFKWAEVARDSVRTDSAGQFSFPLVTDTLIYNRYQYTVEVTSADGETETASRSIDVSRRIYQLSLSGTPTYWIKEHPKQMRFALQNYAHQKFDRKVHYEVYKMELDGSGRLKPGPRVLMNDRMSGAALDMDDIYGLPSDNYRMKMWVEGMKPARPDSLDIKLFSLSDPTVPACTDLFVYAELSENEKEFDVYVGTSHKDVSILGLIYNDDKRLRSVAINISNQLVKRPLQYREKLQYGDFILLECAFLKNKKVYRETTVVERPNPDKRLRLKWQTFRDKLTAGGKEEWRLQVLDKDGKPADAELMATLYDASLDKKYPSSAWRIPYIISRNIPDLFARYSHPKKVYQSLDFREDYLPWTPWTLTKLVNPFRKIHYGLMIRGTGLSRKAMNSANLAYSLDMAGATAEKVIAVQDNMVETGEVATLHEVVEPQEKADESSDVTTRTNFSETAFFYPQLRTNALGEVDIVFTLPESLTTWHLKGLAHNKAMDCAMLDTLAVASKEFMLQASLPRFVRVGDKSTLSATISNLTQKLISGTVRMELFDPVTEKVLHTARQPFTLKAGNTLPVSFAYEVAADHPVMACRMVAEGNGFSDGEQHLLPVLDKKEPVVEAVSVTMTRPGKLTTDLSKLFNNQSTTATNRHLTIEFTGSPAWLAVLALPSVGSPSDDNACSLSAAYYASLVSTWIVEHNPRIRTLMETWKAQGANAPEETLQSELQRNPELKELLLEASPFMEDADRESQQRRLCQQFDLNTLRNQQDLYISKLMDLQTGGGGWSWYKGMPANRYMTLYVMETLLRAKSLTGMMSSICAALVDNGFRYLDGIAKEIEKRMRKDKDAWCPDEFISHYLYINHLSGRQLDKDLKKTCDYFMKRLRENTGNMTIYGKAVAAQLFDGKDDASLRNDMVKTLLEYSVTTPEMGRYYDTFLAQYDWSDYRIPTESMVIETLQKVGGHATEVSEMRQWLLQQKRVQSWDTPLNTVSAVYALLLDNDTLLADKPMPTLQLDGETVGQQATLGLNSVKETLSIPSKQQAPRTFTVEKNDDDFSYGAVYARYTEEVDKLAPYAEGLSIRRDLYVERATNGGVEWMKVTADTKLKVGDKVKSVLTLTADRDMDFIQVKENRASCMEPVSTHSGYRWSYYLAIKDATTEYYMDRLTKGKHQYESLYYLTMPGSYEMGTVKVQSAYAPAFGARTGGQVLHVQH